MQLVDVFKEDMVFLELEARDKEDAIGKLVSSVEKCGLVDDLKIIRDALFEREKLGTTGIGGGIAIPHARSASIKDLSVSFFRSKQGIDFEAVDGKPVNIVFMLLAPISSGGPYLKLLAKISKMLRSDDFREGLMSAASPTEIMEIVKQHD